MDRTLRRLIAAPAVLSLALAGPAMAQNDSPFPVSGWTKGVDYEDRAQVTNRFGHWINPDTRGHIGGYDSPRQSSCTPTRYEGPALGGQGALILLPILLVVVPIVAITTAINNEICQRG
jgi:hypothetical protein